MSKDVDPAKTVKAPDQPADREDDGEHRVPGTLSLFPGKPGTPLGRSPLFRR
jgi:hypothetical protein